MATFLNKGWSLCLSTQNVKRYCLFPPRLIYNICWNFEINNAYSSTFYFYIEKCFGAFDGLNIWFSEAYEGLSKITWTFPIT